ncbi:hypothetical protein RvY_07132 [Ramazzottius varieornatus]|uniref:Uncharacterized protein n=1 Tax=Ramazzottius varieornatus TaxID=947166 RepID=A0A1D1V1A6_RAMVA|nr:hypothetical protein RvY_07132 [Ramazzottius varieornatus]
MDKQLTEVASAKLADIPAVLLEGISYVSASGWFDNSEYEAPYGGPKDVCDEYKLQVLTDNRQQFIRTVTYADKDVG